MSVVSEAVENIASIGADALACPLPWDRELVSIAIISLKRELHDIDDIMEDIRREWREELLCLAQVCA